MGPVSTLARRAVARLGAGRLAAAFFLVAFLAGPALELVAAFLALLAGVAAAFFLVRLFALTVEADFFLVTFFRASFRLAVDLPALAVFLELVFFAALFAVFFLAAFFLATFFLATFFVAAFFFALFLVFFVVFPVGAFFRVVAFFFDAAFFLAGFFRARAAADAREVLLAVFLLVRFLAAAFLVGIQEIPGWLQMQPAIIHR